MKQRLTILLMALLLLSLPTLAQTAPRSVSAGSATLEPKEILQRESPAIVAVYSLDRAGKPKAQGTGFIVRSNGVVVTNLHVVEDAQDAAIKLKSGEIFDNAMVLYYDARHDIAILKISAVGLPTVTLGSAKMPDAGERAYAIGNPEGLEYTISDGLISAHRLVDGTEMLQITAPISHGSSGGPLYNPQGQVVGITTLNYAETGAQNLNFAVPVKYVLGLLESSPRNITVAQLTAQRHPVEQAKAVPASSPQQLSNRGTYVARGNLFRLEVAPGWQVDDPPAKNMLLSMNKSGRATLMVYQAAQDSVDQAFLQQKQAISKEYGAMNDCTDVRKLDRQDMHARIQVCVITLEGETGVVTFAALQSSRTTLGAFGLSTKDGVEDVIDAIGAIEF